MTIYSVEPSPAQNADSSGQGDQTGQTTQNQIIDINNRNQRQQLRQLIADRLSNSQRADEIIALYDKEPDVKKRATLLRELDGIVMSQHHYLLEWYAPFQRMVYWNKFGQPKGLITRIGDYRDPVGLWWVDPQLESQVKAAMADPSKKMPVGAAEDKYWLEFAKIEEQQTNPIDTAAK